MNYSSELAQAIRAAQKAGNLQREFLSKNKIIEKKSDRSPVTQIDKESEEIIRDTLLGAFPDDGFLGEESGDHRGTSGRTWIVDPLDGTRPYIHGIFTFSVLIGLEEEGDMVVGVANFPGLNELYTASRGNGAFCGSTRLNVSSTAVLGDVFGSSYGFVEHHGTDLGERLMSVVRQWDYHYGFMDAYTYMNIAAGKIDACVNLCDKPWDCAAAACIVSEAGGRYTDITGDKTVRSNSIVLTNGHVHDEIIQNLKM